MKLIQMSGTVLQYNLYAGLLLVLIPKQIDLVKTSRRAVPLTSETLFGKFLLLGAVTRLIIQPQLYWKEVKLWSKLDAVTNNQHLNM